MSISAVFSQFNDPIQIQWRTDAVGNKLYVAKNDLNRKIINGQVVLDEIPDSFAKVQASGFSEIFSGVPVQGEFITDYTMGVLTFNPADEGKTVSTISYTGRGFILYPASRMYSTIGSTSVEQNIQDLLDMGFSSDATTVKGVRYFSGSASPTAVNTNDIWFNTATGTTSHWSGTAWTVMNPQYTTFATVKNTLDDGNGNATISNILTANTISTGAFYSNTTAFNCVPHSGGTFTISNSGNTIALLQVSDSTSAVTTKNNTLDDGTGNIIVKGYLTVGNVTSLPTASSTYRGQIIYVQGNGTSTADVAYMCLTSATGTYSWKQIVSG